MALTAQFFRHSPENLGVTGRKALGEKAGGNFGRNGHCGAPEGWGWGASRAKVVRKEGTKTTPSRFGTKKVSYRKHDSAGESCGFFPLTGLEFAAPPRQGWQAT
jgi:hypothetical protein